MGITVKNIWEVCRPHPDINTGDLDASVFAISLDSVRTGKADSAYKDPQKFFIRTYITEALSALLERVIGRLAGQHRGSPVIRLQTPFGGGKTHTMTALYHLARSPEAIEGHPAVEEILDRLGLRRVPRNIRVAVLDGRALDVGERRHEIGLSVRTLWGELAAQLGGREAYELVADADQARIAPGGQRLTELLERYQPALILMDEVVEYLVKAKAVKVGDSNLMQQTSTFLTALSTAVSALPQVVLLVALPSSSLEVSQDDPEAAEWLLQQTVKFFGRVELVETPVAQDEVFGVLRQRLFEDLGNEHEHKRAVRALFSYYEAYSAVFPERLRSPEYKQRLEAAYPFHPELIDLLYNRWGPHPQFQRTRGALRLLALVIRRIWRSKPAGSYFIQPYHVNLSDRSIRGDILKLTEKGMEQVVDGDILDKARRIEMELGGEYSKENLGQGICTCILLYNIHGGPADSRLRGVTEEEIRTAILRPPLNPALVSEILPRLRERLWYLRWVDNLYQFTVRPNLNKVILDKEQEIQEEGLEDELLRQIGRVAGQGGGIFEVVLCPKKPTYIPDRAKPTLVLLPLEVENPQQWIAEAFERAGDGPRANRNMLVFLVPEKTGTQELRAAVRRLMALERIEKSPTLQEILNTADRTELQSFLQDKKIEVEAKIQRMYRAIYRFGPQGPEQIIPRTPEEYRAKDLSEYVRRVLKQEGVLTEGISPEFLIDYGIVDLSQKEISVQQVVNYFTGVPGAPLIPDPRKQVVQAIIEGAEKKMGQIKVGGQPCDPKELPPDLWSRPDVVIAPPEEIKSVPPPPPPTPAPTILRLTLRTSCDQLHSLLVVANELRNVKKATACVIVEDRSGELAKIRDMLDKTIKDFGCSLEWTESH